MTGVQKTLRLKKRLNHDLMLEAERLEESTRGAAMKQSGLIRKYWGRQYELIRDLCDAPERRKKRG